MSYRQAWMSAISELRECHYTEWRLLTLLFRAKGMPQNQIWNKVKGEMVKAFHEEFMFNLKMYQGKI